MHCVALNVAPLFASLIKPLPLVRVLAEILTMTMKMVMINMEMIKMVMMKMKMNTMMKTMKTSKKISGILETSEATNAT
jgi:hypothetical protein